MSIEPCRLVAPALPALAACLSINAEETVMLISVVETFDQQS